MNKDDLIRDVKLILFHFKKWVEENDHWDLFQNLPDDIFSGPQRDQIKDLLYNIYAFDFDYLKKVNNAVDQVPVVSLDRDLKAYKEASNLAKQSCFETERISKQICLLSPCHFKQAAAFGKQCFLDQKVRGKKGEKGRLKFRERKIKVRE